MKEHFIDTPRQPLDRPEVVIDRVLDILSVAAVGCDSVKTDEFRSRLKAYRSRLAESFGTADFEIYSNDCLQVCETFFKMSREYMHERESEFGEIIQILRDSIGLLAGESNSFNEELVRSSERFDRLTEIEDIRKLKNQITMECKKFRRIVEEKQQKDEANHSRLTRRVAHLQGSLEQTREEASQDGLTRIANRATFDKALSQWIAAHNEAKSHFILALLDLDNFKTINDSHGHQIGDRVLFCAAQWFAKCVRANDFLARFGGEEFVILLSESSTEDAMKKFTRLLHEIAASSYKYDVAGHIANISFTASCGLAEFTPNESAETLIRRADAALYAAKHRGKNCVVVAGPAHVPSSLWRSLQPLIPFKI